MNEWPGACYAAGYNARKDSVNAMSQCRKCYVRAKFAKRTNRNSGRVHPQHPLRVPAEQFLSQAGIPIAQV